jgi:acetyl-CoA decarbonylase/synthase complex subunit gamma
MPAKGTDVVKKLPEGGKKNCKECGFPTCFAYAMKLASGGATLEKCPHLTAEVKAELEDALAPPQKLVTIGAGANAVPIGNEEVVYRHDKSFINASAMTLLISDKESDAEIDKKIAKLKELQFNRVGRVLKANLLAPYYQSGDKAKFLALVKKCAASGFGMVIMCDDVDLLFQARDAVGADKRPLLWPITKENLAKAIPMIKKAPTPIAVHAHSVEELIPLTAKLKEEGIDELVIDPGSKNLMDAVRDQTLIRRAALKQNFRPLGYPTMFLACAMAKDKLKETLIAAVGIIKYGAIVVLSDMDKDTLGPLLVLRLNIYTDPRMPMTVEPKVYEIGAPTADSPVLITTNWALTYFVVSSEIEGSKVPAWLLVKESEGLGVLTAWAAGKFNGDNVGPFVKKMGIADKVKNKKLVIPGKVARIKGELEEALPGWEIVIGPREASGIPGFLPEYAQKLK